MNDYARIIILALEEGAQAGEWPTQPDPILTANIIMGSVNQVIITWLLYRHPTDIRRGVAQLGKKLMRLLKAETPEEAVEVAPKVGRPYRKTSSTRAGPHEPKKTSG